MGDGLVLESRAFPLRAEPDPTVRFRGTYREAGWRRCAEASAADGIVFTPWPHERFADCSMPALEAAKCVAKQGDPAFARVHFALYEAFFTRSRNIADRDEVTRIVGECGVDLDRFRADYASGLGREAVVADSETAHADGVRAIPTVIVPETGRQIVGLAGTDIYRQAIAEASR